MKFSALSNSFLLLLSSTIAQAGTMEKLNANSSPWQFEFGARYWLSNNNYTKTLYGNPAEPPISKLSYEKTRGNSAEIFWQLIHKSGLFIKGYAGGGSLSNGFMYDEDFPPAVSFYSKTYQQQKNGILNYLSTDLGYYLFSNNLWQFGLLLGYHYWVEELNTFGCTQMAENQEICANIPPVLTPVPFIANTLNNKANWSSLRIGVTGVAQLNENITLTTDLAYVRSHLDALDFHNQSTTFRPLPETGTGNGFQFDGLINWKMNSNWSVGIGARWWYIVTSGFSHFEETAGGGQPQPIDVSQNSYGLLLQTNYQFNELSNTVDSWAGAFIGANIGYGTNPQTVTIYPTSIAAVELQTGFIPSSPQGIKIHNAGFIGGGQIGYNWFLNKILLGAEADTAKTAISGTNAVLSSQNLTSTKVNLTRLSSIRGRLGTLAADNILVYLTAGASFGTIQVTFDQRTPGVSCSFGICSSGFNSVSKTGWASGAGVEYSVSQQVKIRAEYLYVDLGEVSVNTVDQSPIQATYSIALPFNANIVRLGINYNFA